MAGTQYELDSMRQAELLDAFRLRFKTSVEQARPAPIVVAALPAADPLADLARAIEFERFNLVGTYSETDLHDEFDEWEASSHFLIAIDTEKVAPVGSLRGIVSPAGISQTCKTIHDVIASPSYKNFVVRDADGDSVIDLRDNFDPSPAQLAGVIGASTEEASHGLDRRFVEEFHNMQPGELIYDVATICNLRRARHASMIGPMLYSAVTRLANRFGIEHCVTVLRADLCGQLEHVLGVPIEPLCGMEHFRYCEGDAFDSQPLYINLRSFQRDAARENLRRRTEQSARLGKRYSRFSDLRSASEFDNLFLL